MIVKIVAAPGVEGGEAFALCDDDGKILDQQIETIVHTIAGEKPTVTAKFFIDGEYIRFAK
jgi:hypothetical protein